MSINDALLNVTLVNGGDGLPNTSGYPDDPSDDDLQSWLDSKANKSLLHNLEEWLCEARDGHAENRREQMMDADFYDCLQWSMEDAAVLEDRGQAPLTFPLIKQMCDWVIGTERRTRIDWDVLPRKEEDVQIANVKKQVLKFVSDVNGAGWERSLQFADQVKVGVGWTEECYNNDRKEEPVTVRHQDWKGMWWDPYSRSNVLRDCRYLHRLKWVDLDYACAMFPDRANELRTRAVDTLDPMMEQMELEASLPQLFYNTPVPQRGYSGLSSGLYGSASIQRHGRKRVLLVETWFKKAANTQMILGDDPDDGAGQAYDPKNKAQQSALMNGTVSLVDSVTEEMWFALWSPGLLLRVSRSPYKHNRFPFTPAWAYRRHRDGMPYGLPRPARDSQIEYNKRRSKILFDLSTNRVMYEVDAMDEEDEDRNLEELKRPDGEVRLKSGALKEGKIKVERALDALNGQVEMLAEAKGNIYESTGVTRENTGSSTGDQSGRAILAKQQQGSVTTAELFDNFRQAIQESGQKTLSNCEQFLSLPKIIRIAGPDGAAKWVSINSPVYDPFANKVLWDNDITASEADFIVDETDFRETVRMAMAESLFELIGRMPPDMAMALLDAAIDLTDLPNKQDLANRIRQINGQTAPGAEDSPEAQQAAAAKAQQQQQDRDLALAQRQADIRKTNAQADQAGAKATLDETSAQHTAVRGKAEAMTAASMVHAAPQLVSAADRLWDPQQAFPAQPNQYIPPEP